MSNRIVIEKVEIDENAVTKFFEERVTRYDEKHPVVAILYQDSNPALAESRDQHEKSVALPLLEIQPTDRVLDIGCGIGRWANALAGKVARYHGTDLIKGLTDIATQRFAGTPHVTFQALKAQDNHPDRLTTPPPYDLVIIAGVFAYINDCDCLTVLKNVAECCAPKARIFLREPVGVERRLTLKNIWSDELKHEYSAIYRTAAEFLEMIAATLGRAGFTVAQHAPLLPPELSNRKETTQHYFLIKRGL
ncbi:MAG: hypothetical protein PCFJNLEI_01849 [Verrucomicrobiae bacterium]|nr:hypothetical protein [Verrucomicrobiae bacterium]